MQNKGSKIIIVILVLVILGLIGYIVYDKAATKEEENEVKTETKTEKVNTLIEAEAINIGRDLYVKVKKIYAGDVSILADNADDLCADNNQYKLENGVATVTTNMEDLPLYTKYKPEISTKIKSLFTSSGLNKFLQLEYEDNKGMIVKDKNDNFYRVENLSHSGTVGLDDIGIIVNNIEENSITFTVTDYWFEAGLDDSEYNVNSPKAVKISNTFKIVKDNNTWKVEDYIDSYSKFLERNN